MNYTAVENNEEKDYKYLISNFEDSVIQERFNHLERRVKEFIKNKNYEGKVVLNRSIFDIVLIDYFVDIDRLKKFHNIKNINKHKITAYTAYWWLRRKPLQVVVDKGLNNEKVDTVEELVYVNEQFITSLIIKDFLEIPESEIVSSEVCKSCIEHIFYYLKYRVINAQAIEMMLVMVECGREVGKIEAGLALKNSDSVDMQGIQAILTSEC